MVHLKVVPDDRRERTRELKRQRILAAAGAVIDREGLAGVTMGAVADELDCAVGTLYTAFSSKAALLAALQSDAVATLERSYRTGRARWDLDLAGEDVEDSTRPLVDLLAHAGFLAAAAVVYPDEVALIRELLGEAPPTAPPLERALAGELLPVVHRVLDPVVGRLGDAVDAQSLQAGDPVSRGLIWHASLLGVLRLERLAPVDRHLFRAAPLARSLAEGLLVGWGGDVGEVEVASTWVERLTTRGPLAPPPD